MHPPMGRIRTVKPELFTHGDLFDAEKSSGLPLRLSFIALTTCCDREGRFKWKPRELKLDCLPFDDVDFSRVLDALTTRGFVVRYASPDGQEYGCIPTFTKHQVVNNREKASDIPSPTGTGVVTREARVDDTSATREARGLRGREGKGREGEGNNGVSVDERFEALWSAYGKIGSKPQAFTYWRSLSEVDKMAIEAKLPAYVASTPGGQYRKHLQGWINPKGRLWESAIVAASEPQQTAEAKPKGVWNML